MMFEETDECCRRARDVEKIYHLTALVERLERENQRLRSSPGPAGGELERLSKENEVLRAQMEEMRGGQGTKLSDRYNAKEKATSKVMRSYEDVRHDLQAVRQQHQRTKNEKEQLNYQMAQIQNQNLELTRKLEAAEKMMERMHKQRMFLADKLRVFEKKEEAKMKKESNNAEKKGIDDLASVVQLRKLLKESLQRERAQLKVQEVLQSEVDTLRECATEVKNMSAPELRFKIQQQRLVIQRLESERNVLNDHMEVTCGQQINANVMEQLVHYKKVLDENAELSMRIKLLETGGNQTFTEAELENIAKSGSAGFDEEVEQAFASTSEHLPGVLQDIIEEKEESEVVESPTKTEEEEADVLQAKTAGEIETEKEEPEEAEMDEIRNFFNL